MTQKSTGGVLQIPAAATQKNSPGSKKPPKPAAPRLKLLVRRLPPGLTEEEFKSALGEEWMAGAGKIDWVQYKSGKVSKDPAKPSRPSRAYIHVVSSDHIAPLSDKIRQTSFLDALNSANDPVLLGPPSLEFAPYAKIPGNRVRRDARQGTIDQDPEFITFLESLTQPITRPNLADSTTEGEEKKDTATTTPLVQYIKDKKANKAKEQAATKSSKHGKSEKEAKPEKVKKVLQRPDKDTAQPAATEKTEKKSKTDKAAKEAIKAANKQAASVSGKQPGKRSTTANAKDAAPSAPGSERKRERGNAGAAAKILQRDLGLSTGGGRRKGGKGAAAPAETDDMSKKEAGATTPTEPSKKDTPKLAKASQKGKGGGNENQVPPSSDAAATARPQVDATPPSTPNPAKAPKASNKGKQTAAPPTATATQAFLKHANASQGVTEPLLETAFSAFGAVVKAEIDKKKGFGYVDFAEPSGLQKAIAASPVTVAQSQVVVLERKMNPGGEKNRNKGGGESQQQAGGGGSNNSRGGSSRGPRGGRGSKNKGKGEKEKQAEKAAEKA